LIKIVDYGLGNLLALQNIYKLLNIPVSFAKTAKDLEEATHIILPGVGAFDQAIEKLNLSGMRARLEQSVLEDKIPILGICVGMQIFADRSDEGKLAGLGWISGEVKNFKSLIEESLVLPHMGWNDVHPVIKNELFNNFTNSIQFYLLHSYYFKCDHLDDIAAFSNYGEEFACAVNYNNIYGVQFHPEKSHHFGIQLLKNFSEI
jgi:glutamine amidotransferase